MSETDWVADTLNAALLSLRKAVASGDYDAIAKADFEVDYHAQATVRILKGHNRGNHSLVKRLTAEIGEAMTNESAADALVSDVRRVLRDAATG